MCFLMCDSSCGDLVRLAGLQNQELTDLAKNAYKGEKIREVNEDKQVGNKGNPEK